MQHNYYFFLIFIFLSCYQHTSAMQRDQTADNLFVPSNLGKPLPLFGLIPNKDLNTNEPLFVDFWGGEWVMAPLGKQKRLCAVVVEGLVSEHEDFPSENDNHCRVFTYNHTKEGKEVLATIILKLTQLLLIREHYSFDACGRPYDYKGPLAKNFCETWYATVAEKKPNSHESTPSNDTTVSLEQANKPRHHHRGRTPKERALAHSYLANNPSLPQTASLPLYHPPTANPYYTGSPSRFFANYSNNTK